LAAIDLGFDLFDLKGATVPAASLLGRPTILVVLRYIG